MSILHQARHPAPGRASRTRQGIPHQAGHPAPGRASCTRQGIPHWAGHPALGRACLHQAGLLRMSSTLTAKPEERMRGNGGV